jgi:hypothetical protein
MGKVLVNQLQPYKRKYNTRESWTRKWKESGLLVTSLKMAGHCLEPFTYL